MSESQAPVQKVRIPEKYKGESSYIRSKFIEIIDEQTLRFTLDPNEKSRYKTMLVEYINLVLKVHRDLSEYVEEESESEEEEEDEEVDELFEQKNKLLQKALEKKVEECQKTQPTLMNIDLDISKPERMFVVKNGAETPIEHELSFAAVQQSTKQIERIHEQQTAYCGYYRELLSHQKWLSDKKL